MSDLTRTLAQWLQNRLERWQNFANAVKEKTDTPDRPFVEVSGLARDFRALAGDLSLARSVMPNSQLTQQLEILFARANEFIYRQPHHFWRDIADIYREQISAIAWSMRKVIIATVLLFVASGLIGAVMVSNEPELIGLFASEQMIEHVHRGELWTDGLLNIMPSAILSVSIISNNIMVTLMAFTLGAFLGLGTLYIIGLNGLMLGGIFVYTAQFGLAQRLFSFIVAHGIVELSVICLAGAAGVGLGEALVRPGNRRRIEAFEQEVAKAGKLLIVCIPFLVGAGFIEGYISPNDDYDLISRCVIGFGYEIVFLGVLSGKVWKPDVSKVNRR